MQILRTKTDPMPKLPYLTTPHTVSTVSSLNYQDLYEDLDMKIQLCHCGHVINQVYLIYQARWEPSLKKLTLGIIKVVSDFKWHIINLTALILAKSQKLDILIYPEVKIEISILGKESETCFPGLAVFQKWFAELFTTSHLQGFPFVLQLFLERVAPSTYQLYLISYSRL